MPKIEFTPAEIKAYWDTTPKIPYYVNNRYSVDEEVIRFPRQYDALHPFYVECLTTCESMRVHADGFYPYRLIEDRRPNESQSVIEYRHKIWCAKTKPTFSKVVSSLMKIRRSADWMIDFPKNDAEFSRIKPEETLQVYTDNNLPYFKSMTNWAFNILLRKYLIDPNGVVFVAPLPEETPANGYLKPYPIIYDCINVLDFVKDNYAVLLNPFGAKYIDSNGFQRTGRSMWIVTTLKSSRYDQTSEGGDYFITDFNHNLGFLPVTKLGGVIIAQNEDYFLYESRIAGMIPELDEAVRENSDLQASKVMHQYPERWEITNNECLQCKGIGRVQNQSWSEDCNCPQELLCEACHGQGVVSAGGPYSKILVKQGDALTPGGTSPIPPAGFVEKDVQIIELQEASVKNHIYEALSAINFEFLANAPLAQSGVGKQYDRNESNNTTHAVAEDIVAIMDFVYKSIAYYRYLPQYPALEIDKMLPTIPVPENFDLYSIADAQDLLAAAKTGKTNAVIINAMEKDFANKLFSADTSVRDLLDLIISLDPLSNVSEDDKMTRLSNKGITLETYVISSNIQPFVEQAIEDDPEFADKDLKDQQAVMVTMAQAVIKANSASAKIVPIDQNGLFPVDGQGNPIKPPTLDANGNPIKVPVPGAPPIKNNLNGGAVQ